MAQVHVVVAAPGVAGISAVRTAKIDALPTTWQKSPSRSMEKSALTVPGPGPRRHIPLTTIGHPPPWQLLGRGTRWAQGGICPSLQFTADGEDLDLGPGSWLHMSPGTPHARKATEPTVMLLTLLGP